MEREKDDTEARHARAERLHQEIEKLKNPPGDPALIPGLMKAIELADAYRKYDLKNAENDQLDAEDQDRALNCSMRMGQFICVLKEAVNRLHQGEPLPNPPVDILLYDLPGLIKFARQHAPPNMQQDDQDFEEWVKSAWGTGYYFSWPRGEKAKVTIHVNLRTKDVSFTTNLTDEEGAIYKEFAEQLRKFLGW
jgi:hypothetical protein